MSLPRPHEPQSRHHSPDSAQDTSVEIVALGDFHATDAALEAISRRGATGGGGGGDPALRDLAALRAHVDRQMADLLGPVRTPPRTADRRRAQRWARILPVAACAVLIAAGIAVNAGTGDRQAVTAEASTPVSMMLDAAEADLASAALPSVTAADQATLVQHSRQLVERARAELPHLTGPDRVMTEARIHRLVASTPILPSMPPVTLGAPGPTSAPKPTRDPRQRPHTTPAAPTPSAAPLPTGPAAPTTPPATPSSGDDTVPSATPSATPSAGGTATPLVPTDPARASRADRESAQAAQQGKGGPANRWWDWPTP